MIIPRRRLRWIPSKFKAAHEYCFFLHDECVRALVEYEAAQAHNVRFKFKKPQDAPAFEELAKDDPIRAMRVLGYERQARKLVLNQVTMALVSDCLHHIYEVLTCVERRKIVVAFNLLRKPLKDSLLLLSWMLGDEDGFYIAFTTNPEFLTPKRMGNRRLEILEKAIAKLRVAPIFDATVLNEVLFNRKSNDGFEPLFQKAVHLVTVEYAEIRTEPENFNFVFKRYTDPDIDEGIYRWLPYVLLYLSHVIMGLFNRMRPMDKGATDAFYVRTANGYALACDRNADAALADMNDCFRNRLVCPKCKMPLDITRHNGLRILLAESIRCTRCGCVSPFPFSWQF